MHLKVPKDVEMGHSLPERSKGNQLLEVWKLELLGSNSDYCILCIIEIIGDYLLL